jgi:alkylation response protein AidB-like acyl-CoA dehydrogenase
MTLDLSDRRDIDFVLYEQFDLQALLQHPRYAEFNRRTIDLIVGEARKLAIKEIAPTNRAGDQTGCTFAEGTVRVPEAFHRIFELYRRGEWITMIEDPAVGGQGLPVTASLACHEYFTGANCSFSMYPGLCHGAGKLIEIFGTAEQKNLFLEKMYTGQWGGSMLLTEPGAGSDVGALETSARPLADGTYAISGSKIFITGGEQDLTENIIHPVLARVEGAPEGTRGISLFIVPKIWVNPDGRLGAPNDVVCTGIEHKLGIRASATCALTLGGRGGCRGLLLGEINKGMRAMFHMMNEARLGVGLQGFAMAAAAYAHALNYARERRQGKHLLRMLDAQAPSVPIIEHPDVRRMLMHMKAYVDGMRSFIYYIGLCFDRMATADGDETRQAANGLIDVLTPVVKAYCTDRAFEVCTLAVQTFGGYGYTCEYPVEQYLRDCKITSIYEGTNGIQAMDLLGRKLGLKGGRFFMALLAEMQQTVAAARKVPILEDLADRVETAVKRLGEVALTLGQAAMSERVLSAFSAASPFLDVVGDTILAWMHLSRAAAAVPGLEKACGGLDPALRREKAAIHKTAAFYEGQIRTAEYFIRTVLPGTLGRMNAVAQADPAAVEMPDAGFGG